MTMSLPLFEKGVIQEVEDTAFHPHPQEPVGKIEAKVRQGRAGLGRTFCIFTLACDVQDEKEEA